MRGGARPRRRAALAGLIGAALAACEGGSPGAMAPDLGSRGLCEAPLVEGERWRVSRCDDPSRLALRSADGVELLGLGPSLHLASPVDGWIHPEDWPVVAWQGRADGGSARWHDPERGTAVLDLTLAGACVDGTMTLSVPVVTVFDRIMPFSSELNLPIRGVEFEIGAARPPTVDRPSMLIGTSRAETRALAVGGLDPAWPLSSTVGAGVSTELVDDALTVGPESPVTLPFAICATGEPAGTWAAFTALASARHPRPADAPLVGWATPPRPLDALRADAERLAEWFAGSAVRPLVLIDGEWYAGRGDWSPRAPLDGGIRAALPPAVDVGVVWPALQVAADGPVAAAHPEWLDPRCADDCPRLDARIPAVRDHLAREALALADQGLRVFITGLPADPAVARALLATLPGVATLDAAPAEPTPALGLSPAAGMPAAERIEQQALALAARSWMRRNLVLSAGALTLVGRDPAAARQAAAVAALAGVRLLADAPGALEGDPNAEVARALLRAPALADARPLVFSEFEPPPIWRADRAVVFFNWSGAPRTVEAPAAYAPELADAVPLFGRGPDDPAALGEAARVTIAPGDAQVWVTVDEPPPAR
ncbi:MAG: hypothetical protein R3F65_24355 [bacterium]